MRNPHDLNELAARNDNLAAARQRRERQKDGPSVVVDNKAGLRPGQPAQQRFCMHVTRSTLAVASRIPGSSTHAPLTASPPARPAESACAAQVRVDDDAVALMTGMSVSPQPRPRRAPSLLSPAAPRPAPAPAAISSRASLERGSNGIDQTARPCSRLRPRAPGRTAAGRRSAIAGDCQPLGTHVPPPHSKTTWAAGRPGRRFTLPCRVHGT